MSNKWIKFDEYGLFIFPVRICTDRQFDSIMSKLENYLWFREYNAWKWLGLNFFWRKRGLKGGEGWKP